MGNTILKEDLSDVGIPVFSATEKNVVFGYVKNPKLVLNRGDLIIPARGNSIGSIKVVTNDKVTCTQTTIYSKKCITEFDNCYKKEKALIEWIKAYKIKVLNSGSKIA